MVVSRETVGLSNIVRKFLPPFVHTVWETLKYRNVWHLRSLARCNFQETKTPFIKPVEIKYIKSWIFKVHRGNDNSYPYPRDNYCLSITTNTTKGDITGADRKAIVAHFLTAHTL